MAEEAGGRIVNVDDNPASLYLRSRMLRQAGYEVWDAPNGLKGLDLVRERRPHVVLLDVNMPDISGLEVCRIIKEDPRTSATLVLRSPPLP